MTQYYEDREPVRAGYLTIRVPSERYDAAIAALSALGVVTDENENAENATAAYYDVKARLTAKEAEEARLLQLIDMAKTIEDLILLEGRISGVRADIESYRTQMMSIDRRASFSTITVNLSESPTPSIAPIPDTFGDRVKSAFINSINGLSRFLQSTVVFFSYVIVPLLLIAAVAGIILFIVRKVNKKGDKPAE